MQRLADAYTAFSSSEAAEPSACLCLMLDHWDRLRDQYGYRGLLALVGKVRDLVQSRLDVEAVACCLNERSVLVLLPHCSLKTAEQQVNRLFGLINHESFAVGERTVALSVSLGYVEFDHRFTNSDHLLLSLVKTTELMSAAGGNQLKHIQPDVSTVQGTRDNRQMLGLLMESLRKNALKVLFQPLMATADEPSQSFQLLPRLVAADASLIPAASFVSVAREARVLGVLDRWMIQRAVHLLVNDYHLQPIRFFLSQGDSLLVNSERREWLRALIQKHPSVSGKLVFDFVIEDALANLKSSQDFIRLADELGIEVCFSQVDEHSKWELLAEGLRVEYIKMSPQFVLRLGQDDGLEHVFREVSAAVREQGTKIIMPMVEDASLAANLWRTGADYMQGHMIQEESETLELSD